MAAASPSRSKLVLRRLAIVAVALVVGIVLAEGGLRLWMRVQGRPFDARAARIRMRTLLSPIQRFVPANTGIDLPDGNRRPILHPYYASEENHDTGDVLKHFREGARPEDFEVLLLGGSVAAFLGVTEGDAIQAAFQDFEQLRDRRVVFLNGAHAAHKQPQQVNRVALLLAFGYRPDLVILLDGFNETALAAENAAGGVNPLWPTGPVWSAVVGSQGVSLPERMDVMADLWQLHKDSESLVSACLRYGLDKSALGSTYALARLDRLGRTRNELQRRLEELGEVDLDERGKRQARGPVFEAGIDAVLESSVKGWRECSRSLRALCESRGIPYVHVVQPALFDTGSKPMSAEERKIENPRDAWLHGARTGYPMLRAAAAELAAEGEVVVDATVVFQRVEETLYIDPCHVNPRGNQLLREFLVTRFPKHVLER